MERKIGEIFEYNGGWYQCVEGAGCYKCAFNRDENTCTADNPHCICRSDKKDVVFKKLEKVGEPYVAYGKVRQKYKLYIPLTITKGISERDISCDDVHKIVDIANKQNKEDMEDLDKIKVRDYTKVEELNVMEEKKLNLKPFDIQKAREGKPVCTRDGRNVRIICFDAKGDYPIVALIESGNIEGVQQYMIDGHCTKAMSECYGDLMMLPEKKEGWVNIYKSDNGIYYTGAIFYEKNDALVNTAEIEITTGIPRDCIDTVKIEWEE